MITELETIIWLLLFVLLEGICSSFPPGDKILSYACSYVAR